MFSSCLTLYDLQTFVLPKFCEVSWLYLCASLTGMSVAVVLQDSPDDGLHSQEPVCDQRSVVSPCQPSTEEQGWLDRLPHRQQGGRPPGCRLPAHFRPWCVEDWEQNLQDSTAHCRYKCTTHTLWFDICLCTLLWWQKYVSSLFVDWFKFTLYYLAMYGCKEVVRILLERWVMSLFFKLNLIMATTLL